MLHGGPGMSYTYLDDLADEIGSDYRIASFQQRGIAPSMLTGPYDIDTHIADVRAVLDALEWPTALIVGHSWGGHLAYHLAVAAAERLSGVLCVDPLGAVGDGGEEVFGAELMGRIPEEDRRIAEELDGRALAGEGSAEAELEGFRLVWPGYFADPGKAPPMPPLTLSVEGYSECFTSIHERLPALESALPSITVPLGIVAGASSPMPESAARDVVGLVPGTWVEVVEGAGHFPWYERPGCVRAALERLAQG
jgi:pimeloyl-ACP methyl ester carboxylesterase